MIYVICFVFMGIGWLVSYRLKSKFKKFSKIPLQHHMTGKEVAEKMLSYNRIFDVKVVSVQGELTDHYNPVKKTVNLSNDVYHGSNAASTAIAAHECGHAVQHATAYSMLTLRSALVPLQNISSKIINIVFIVGMLGALVANLFPFDWVLYIIIAAYGVITLFSLVTLPVEFDASNRALKWIEQQNIVNRDEYAMAKNALTWAALTYVVAAIGSVVTLLYYVSMLSGRD